MEWDDSKNLRRHAIRWVRYVVTTSCYRYEIFSDKDHPLKSEGTRHSYDTISATGYFDITQHGTSILQNEYMHHFPKLRQKRIVTSARSLVPTCWTARSLVPTFHTARSVVTTVYNSEFDWNEPVHKLWTENGMRRLQKSPKTCDKMSPICCYNLLLPLRAIFRQRPSIEKPRHQTLIRYYISYRILRYHATRH